MLYYNIFFVFCIIFVDSFLEFKCNSDLMACGGANYVTTYELVYFDTCFEKIELEYWNSLNTNYLINRRKNCLVYDSQAVTQNTILGCMSFNKVKTQLENSHYIEVSPPANISVTDCIKICTTIRYDFAILVGADKFNRKNFIRLFEIISI